MIPCSVRSRMRSAGFGAMLAILFVMPAAPVQAQGVSVDGGLDLFSSYLWRGIEFESGLQVQPWAALERGGWTFGAWGSFGFDQEYSDLNFWLSYGGELPTGSFLVTLYDYYSTTNFRDWSNWRGVRDGEGQGTHVVELMTEYYGPESLPIRLLVGSTVYNDPKPSVYAEVGYDSSALGLDWGAAVGGMIRDGGYYEQGSGSITNLSLTASREVAELLGRPLRIGGLAMYNPNDRNMFYAAMLSF